MNTALFWQTYLSNYPRFVFIVMFGILVYFIIRAMGFKMNPWVYFSSYFLADPFNYYWITYVNLPQ